MNKNKISSKAPSPLRGEVGRGWKHLINILSSLTQIFCILRWHKRTFPTFTYQEQQEKLAAEIREFEDALGEFIRHPLAKNHDAVKEELTDIVIAVTNLYRYPEMRKLIANKMKINHTRTWQKGQHQ